MLTNTNNSNKTSLFSDPDSWRRLQLFNYSRILLSLFFVTIYLNNWLPGLMLGNYQHTDLFVITSFIYLLASLFYATQINAKKTNLDFQVILHTLTDIACIVALMHATGGIRSGLGMLLIISISMSSLFLHKRLAIFFASIAAITIIFEQLYSQFIHTAYSPDFTQAGLLGILIFASTLLTIFTANRLRLSEKLAKDASEELEAIVQMNEQIIKSMRTGLMVIQNNGRVLMANEAALELLGQITIDTNTYLKDTSIELYNRFIDWNNDTIQNHKPIQQTHGLPDLQPGFSRINKSEVVNEKKQGRILIFLEDATQITQRFQQVKLASLGRLTASIAHEIRNPLAAINHAGQLLEETATDASDVKLTNIINSQAKRLNGIVENVLQLSRQQRGSPETLVLYHWLLLFREEFIATHNIQAYQFRIAIEPKDIEISFDSSQLHQVMWNLCTNSINHSQMDLSNIMISMHGEIDDDSKQPFLNIIDNGPGINEETQTHIFDPFFTTSSDGTGLGLYITKEVIESNRAKIRHISPPSGGTCFRIQFQHAQQQQTHDNKY